MSKPALAVTACDAKACASCNATKRVGRPRCVLSHELFLKRPSGLDRIEVRRVWWLIDDAHTTIAAHGNDACVVMRAQVVHHDHIASSKFRQELSRDPFDETIAVRRLPNRREYNPAAPTNRAEQSEVLAAIHRHAIDEFFAAFYPRVTAAHRDREPRFIEKHEAIDRDAS